MAMRTPLDRITKLTATASFCANLDGVSSLRECLPFMTGQQAWHFQLLERIDRGGMGVVYNAMDTCRNLIVALKVLSEAISGDGEARERFPREARAASMRDQANTCAALDSGEH